MKMEADVTIPQCELADFYQKAMSREKICMTNIEVIITKGNRTIPLYPSTKQTNIYIYIYIGARIIIRRRQNDPLLPPTLQHRLK